jgi:hypothetical protein
MMWEVFSGGLRPYDDVIDVEHKIVGGDLLKRPEKCPIEMYKLMLMCWNREPSKRPSFAVLLEQMSAVAEAVLPGYLDLNAKRWNRSFTQ